MANIMRCTINIEESKSSDDEILFFDKMTELLDEQFSNIIYKQDEKSIFLDVTSKNYDPIHFIQTFLKDTHMDDLVVNFYAYNSTSMVQHHLQVSSNEIIEKESIYPNDEDISS